MAVVKSVADQAYESVKQFELLLQCCPLAEEGVVSCPSPLRREELARCAGMRRGDETWTQLNQHVQELLSEISTIKNRHSKITSKRFHLYTWDVCGQLQSWFDRLTKLTPLLDSLNQMFVLPMTSEPSMNSDPSVLTQCLRLTRENILSHSEDFRNWSQKLERNSYSLKPVTGDSQSPVSQFEKDLESCVLDVLLVIQKMVKSQGQSEDVEQEQEEQDEDEDDLLDGVLVEKLHDSLGKHWSVLGIDKKTASLQTLLTKLQDFADRGDMVSLSRCLTLVKQCVPVLDQFVKLTQFYLTQSIASHRSTAKLLSILLNVFTELTLKGFCLPADYSEEAEGEGATEFEDTEGCGMGEGEGVKDVSDQIENEDQLDEARKAGEEKDPEDTSQQPDIADEENGIEMSEDFDGKLHDMETADGEEDESDEDNPDENDLDKQLGDVDDQNAEKLDDQVWGSDDDEEDDQQQNKEQKEESGPGAGKQSEPELVAKDDNEDKTEAGPEHGQEEKKDEPEAEDKDEQKIHEQENVDESEYDENQVDPYYGEQQKQEEEQQMELPDDLKLDEEEGGEEQDGTAEQEENPFDIDKAAEDAEEKMNEAEDDGEKEESEAKDEQMDVDDETKNETDEQKEPDEKKEDTTETNEDIAMETEEEKENESSGKKDMGLEPQDDANEEEASRPDNADKTPEERSETAEQQTGQAQAVADQVEESDTAQERSAAASTDDQQQDGIGQAEADDQTGQDGQTSAVVSRGASADEDKQQTRQKPGESNMDRSLGSTEEKVHRRLKTTDNSSQKQEERQEGQQEEAELYEHVKEPSGFHDTQTLDAATADQEQQQQQQPVVATDDEEEMQEAGRDEDVEMRDSDPQQQVQESREKMPTSKLRSAEDKKDGEGGGEDGQKVEVEGDIVPTHSVQRPLLSTVHTDMEVFMDRSTSDQDVERLRSELEQQMCTWSHPAQGSRSEEQSALEAWHQYEALTSNLSQELCEQLRLVLEPTQATKLRGDYRTGKRLNMRKVIPYIASQFRKDKIWLRRTKPHKRQYQILLAIDDSSSMMDNHSKQLAFESLSVVANALTLLESGELAICSFGESVELLHPFHEQFTSHSGSRILQRFTFEQKKTRIAELLKHVTGIMLNARSSPRYNASSASDISQLLLVVSDGRGLFLEGMEVVRQAVRQAREANVFLVFVIIDNPVNKDSILDIRVPFFKAAGQIPEIHSYMDHFPFPFYIILRDINSLPHTLSDALRQWFELVTAADK